MERRLAAILIADAVGYGRLSQVDEEGTRARFQVLLKDVFEPEIATHGGRLVKTMGDGLLVEFQSVVNALRCALYIQRAVAEQGAGVPSDRKLQFRIAINLGDVIVEGEDIHGNGVNIADRLQALASPGGVVISGTAYDHVTNKLDVGFEFLGEQQMKNIAEPVRVYGVLTDPTVTRPAITPHGPAPRRHWKWAAAAAAVLILLSAGAATWLRPWAPDTRTTIGSAAPADGRPALAVLPFDNLSDDKQQGYLADGIAEDLTTELARIPGLFVVSRNAAFGFRGQSLRPAEIANRLGVRYVLEGSVRRTGQDMRINAQLIDTTTGGHIWAERFDGAWADVFDLQDKIVGNIATALKLRLVAGQRAAQTAGGTSNPTAYEAYLQGVEFEHRAEPEDLAKAVKRFEQAVALDPNFGSAIAELAWVHWAANGVGSFEKALGLSEGETIVKANAYLEEAAKHPSPAYYQMLAERLLPQQKSDEAIAAVERAIALDSSDPYAYHEMSFALTLNGRAADGLGYLDAAARVDPDWTPWRYYLAAMAYFSMDRFEDAAASLEKIKPQSKTADFWTNYVALQLLTATYGHLGRAADAASAREKLKPYVIGADDGEFTGLIAMRDLPFKNYGDLDRVLDGLRKAGVPDLPFGFDPKSKDRLSGAEIKALIFGHEIRGHQLGTGDAYSRTTATDGTSSVTVGTWSDKGVSRIEGDTMCSSYPTGPRACLAFFRNPGGTLDHMNEYVAIRHDGRYEFSVVK